ncbi:unnamed protein product [Rhodiola kirilowii]
MDAENGSGKSDHPNDDIFRKGQPEKLTDTADSSANSAAVHPGNPFENWDQPLLSFSSRSSSSSSSSDLHEHSATEQPKDADGPNDSMISNHSSSQKTTQPDRSSSGVAFFNPRQTPPIHVMDRSENYDPSRIPVSVFTPKSSSPMDWSVASNESLFSLQVGNNSFNRDHFLMMGVDLRKSGELFKLDELNKSGELYKSGELFSLRPSTPITIPETTIAETRESTDNDTDVGTPKSAITDAKSESPHKDEHLQSQPVSTNLSTKSSHSDGSGVSGASIGSFAFPILTEAKRDSTEKDEPVAVNVPQKQISKTSMRKSISAQLSAKMPSCNLCCCYCSCSCLSWRPRCWRSFCC